MRIVHTAAIGASALSLCIVAGCHRGPDRTVAEVLGSAISLGEFQDRYQKYITSTGERDNILVREKVLNNMINERLIFDDLTRRGMDNDAVYRKKMDEITRQAMLDGYSKRISVDTLTVSQQELWKEFRATNSKVSARYVYAGSEEEAWKLRDSLDHGASFEALARERFADPQLSASGGFLGYFGWGDMEEALQDVAFSLPVGTLSDPVRLKVGYAIIKVENRVEQPLASEMDFAKKKEKLEQAILKRKTIRLVKAEAEGIAKDLNAKFNQPAVAAVLAYWPASEDRRTVRSATEQPAPVDLASMPMVTFRTGQWTIGDFLTRAESTTPKERRRVRTAQDVEDVAIGLATRDVLLDRARAAGMAWDAGVLRQIRRRREEILLRRWADAIEDTVGASGWDEGMLRAEYEKDKSLFMFPPRVNAAEILVESKEKALSLLRSIRGGADFGALARKYSVRRWSAEQGGELGFGTMRMFSPLGEKFFAAKVGEILGPEIVQPYFGVFKILGREEGREKTYGEARDEVIQRLLPERKQQAFASGIAAIRLRSRFTIDMNVLGDVVIQPN